MTPDEARSKAAALKSGDQFTIGGEPFTVSSHDCGVVEFHRPEHADITGAYHRAPVEALAIKLLAGDLAIT